jgi:glycine/D-amino acid oxidase-like deaminating enzyme
MLGVTTALTTGRVMADLLVRGRASVDLSPFDPARFAPR